MLEYLSFNPSECDFGSPRVPVLPPPEWHAFRLFGQKPTPDSDRPNVLRYARGRYALAAAIVASDVHRDRFLAPAYHCRTMIDAAIRLGYPVELYPLDRTLTVVPAALEEMLGRSPSSVVLIPHYFGFPQPHMAALRQVCLRHDATMIEDCSHILPTWPMPPGTGTSGDFCIASPYKFYPAEDGGWLWQNGARAPTPPPPLPRSTKDQIKSWIRLACALVASKPTGLPLPTSDLSPLRTPCGIHHRVRSSETSIHYNRSEENVRALASSRWIIRVTDVARLAESRRQRYREWATFVSSLPNCEALRPDLPDDVVPYMFPLLLTRAEKDFTALKRLGLPIWRWDDMAVSECETASEYRVRLLHLPCHQHLSEPEMSWMTATLAAVMSDRDVA